MSLQELKPKNKKAKKRVGRGNGSGHGTYSCRGQKGQSSRTGGRRRPGFEGGQTPLYRKMPKLKGFKNPNRIEYKAINVGALEEMFKEGEVDLTNIKTPVKLLGDGEVTKKFTVKVAKASASAIEKIEKAGGSCEVTTPKEVKETDKEAKKAKRAEERAKKADTKAS
jgi:large subunit ribosomal protein L15